MKNLSKIKEFLFGQPSRKHDIEAAWRKAASELESFYSKKISALEQKKMNEIGFPSDAPKTIDEKKHRLESIDAEIKSITEEMYAEDDKLFFKMLDDVNKDAYASATCLGRIWLWMYWHA